jgi:hypothetical protein
MWSSSPVWRASKLLSNILTKSHSAPHSVEVICICIKYADGSTSGFYFDGVGCAMRLSKILTINKYQTIVVSTQIVQARSFLWKVGEHAIAEKETLKFGSIFGSLPDVPSLRPKVERERSQVALFLLCVVSPGHRGGSRYSFDGGLSYGAIFSIIDGTNCSHKAVLVWR